MKSGARKSVITDELIDVIKKDYLLDWAGIHGILHWKRVYENGMLLVEQTGANRRIVELFAFFHDSKRIGEGQDFGHGWRAAEYAKILRGHYFDLSDKEFDLFYTACYEHTEASSHPDITIQVCFDSDRLDIGRIGVRINPKYLSTDAAKNLEVIKGM